jgi:hypothetical protein
MDGHLGMLLECEYFISLNLAPAARFFFFFFEFLFHRAYIVFSSLLRWGKLGASFSWMGRMD